MKTDNELVAEFMGLKKVRIGYFGVKPGDDLLESETKWQVKHTDWLDKVGLNEVGTYAVNVEDDYWIPWEEVNYSKSWDWLMPVVEKINGLNYNVHIYPTRARFYKNNTDFIESIHPGYSLIDVVYSGVVEFIKWYNSKKQ